MPKDGSLFYSDLSCYAKKTKKNPKEKLGKWLGRVKRTTDTKFPSLSWTNGGLHIKKKKWQNETRIFSAQFFGLASQAMAELSKRYSLTTPSLRAPTGREKLGGTNTNGLNLGLGGRESEQRTIKRPSKEVRECGLNVIQYLPPTTTATTSSTSPSKTAAERNHRQNYRCRSQSRHQRRHRS